MCTTEHASSGAAITLLVVMNGISSAVAGINSGLANLASDAQVVAAQLVGADNGASVVGALVDATQQRLAVDASAKVLASEDQTLGSLIDVFA
jgi:hypothetical protein